MEGLLTGPQLDKFERVQKYLAISVPNEWRTLAELDHVLSSGAQLVRFPWDWVRLLKDTTRDSTYGIQMRLPSIASGQGKEAIALRFSSLKFANQEELIGALNSPYNASSSTKTNTGNARSREDNRSGEQVVSSRIECVGTNTQSLAQGDALTEHIVRQAIASQSILYVTNSSGGLAKRFQRRGDGLVGGGGEDDADGEGTGGRALDGGRSRLSQWLTRAPLGVLRSSLKTRRGIIETSYGGAGIPLSMQEGEEMIVRVQRQDDSANRARYDRGGLFGTAASSSVNEKEGNMATPFSHPKGTLIILSLLVNDMIPSVESSSGVVIGPCDLAFNADGQLADIKVTARKKGSYILNFKVTVQSPDTDAYSGLTSEHQETVYECSIRLIVKEVFSYSHALNHANTVKGDVCDFPNAVQPGGVALFRSDLFPLALPREYCLPTFAESSLTPNQQIAQHNQKVRAALQGGAAAATATATAGAGGGSGGNQQHQHQMPRHLSWWWCDISPNLSALAEMSRPEAAELKACASMAMEGAFLFRSVLDTSVGGGVTGAATSESGNWDASYRDADGNLDAAKVQRKLQEEARERAEKAKALAARRFKKKQRNRELTNTHLLNYGIDLRKPYRK